MELESIPPPLCDGTGIEAPPVSVRRTTELLQMNEHRTREGRTTTVTKSENSQQHHRHLFTPRLGVGLLP
ncbi:hypothetical protein SESBI_25907 [Sesbania bispinosa]|nr:hypothetical protein SESBI_25907 [Sesbania bispinosa]